MDLSDINKVGSRKRMNTDAQNLKEKMSRESAKIIKLKVAQDTAAELRQRPEVPATRNVCDAFEEVRAAQQRAAADHAALEEDMGRVRAALQRAAADRAALAAVLAISDQLAAEVERFRLSAEHGAQLTAAAEAARRGDEAASEAARADEHCVRHAELSERVASSDAALREMQRTVAELRAEREDNKREAEEQQRAAGAAAAEARRALDSRASTVAWLMSEVAGEAQACARLQADLEASARARAAVEEELRLKEDELAQQTTIILEIRSEKERLQDTIRGMQGTIDNIQKERTRERAEDAAPRGTALDMREVNASFNALASAYGPPSAPAPRAPSPRAPSPRAPAPRAPAPRAPPPPSPEQRHPQSTAGAAEGEDTPLSLSQVRAQQTTRRFFRTKRLDGKLRKQK